MSAASYSICII